MNPRLAYLVSQYPTVGHSFLLREIRAMRALGFDLFTVSVSPPDRPGMQMTSDEREEAARTRYVTTTGLLVVIAIHLRVLFRNAGGYFRGLGAAIRLGGFHPNVLLFHLLYFAEAVIAGHWIVEAGYSRVHTHFSSTVALLMAHVFPLRISMTLHGSDEFQDPRAFHMAEKLRAAMLVCTISEYGRAEIMKASDARDWSKIRVIPLGVDVSVFTPRPFRERPEVFEIVAVGRLVPLKGYPVLLEAIDQLIRAGRVLRLRIAGEGPARASLKGEIARRNLGEFVQLEGNLNAPDVLELYRQADIFVLASLIEAVPVVLMEAMAMEIPCVATRVTGVPELIRDGKEGLLVTPSSSRELAAAIGKYMDDPGLRRQLGEAGRVRVTELFNLGRNTNALAEVLRESC